MAERIILGIDPGSRQTGYAILVEKNRSFEAVECNVIISAHLEDHTERLRYIYEAVAEILKRHNPHYCAVETPVYGIDPLAMLKLGRAQAAAILAISNHQLAVAEYYPKAVKKAVTGNGNASKKQVAFMLEKLVKLPDNRLTGDASDALAVAWCHSLSVDLPGKAKSAKKYHQNNRKSSWKSFIEENPGRVK
ncbi:MAG: crossover junction endodeoxyribonuclease RuvC [Balneolaceae bacterium]